MTSQPMHSPAPLQNAFYELALAKQAPDAELLDEFVRRYPEHAAALTDFAIELALDAATDAVNRQTQASPTGASLSVSKAMSRFHNRLHAVQDCETGTRIEEREMEFLVEWEDLAGVIRLLIEALDCADARREFQAKYPIARQEP